MGKQMGKTREEMEKQERKKVIWAKKKEKEDAKKERDRIRAELAKDKLERQSNGGKLKSQLGADGYNPSAIQYEEGEEKVRRIGGREGGGGEGRGIAYHSNLHRSSLCSSRSCCRSRRSLPFPRSKNPSTLAQKKPSLPIASRSLGSIGLGETGVMPSSSWESLWATWLTSQRRKSTGGSIWR